jgi:hypothetical protein
MATTIFEATDRITLSPASAVREAVAYARENLDIACAEEGDTRAFTFGAGSVKWEIRHNLGNDDLRIEIVDQDGVGHVVERRNGSFRYVAE